jgi:hypothetical protein
MLDETNAGLNQSTAGMLHTFKGGIKGIPPKAPLKEGESRYVEAKTLAEMEFDVEEYKIAKEEN